MKKILFLPLALLSFVLMSFSTKVNKVDESSKLITSTCCSYWVQFEGEWFEAVEVCGGSGPTAYMENCIRAEQIFEDLLADE